MEVNLEKRRPLTTPARSTMPEAMPATSVDFTDLDKITEDSLDFSALTDGLGFHPKERALGTLRPSNTMDDMEGLVAPAPAPAPAPEADTAASLAATPVSSPISDPLQTFVANAARTAARNVDFAAVTAAEPEPRGSQSGIVVATPRERISAFALDLAIIALPLWATFLLHFGGEMNFVAEHGFSAAGFTAIVFSAYLLIAESLGGQSLGKMAFHLVVVEDNKYAKPIGFHESLRRLGFFLLGSIPFGLGALAAIWDSNSRTWHDRLSGTAVERKFED